VVEGKNEVGDAKGALTNNNQPNQIRDRRKWHEKE